MIISKLKGKCKMEKIYNKLVRDNIPNIIKENGETPFIKVLDEISYKKELEKNYTRNIKKFLMQMVTNVLKN